MTGAGDAGPGVSDPKHVTTAALIAGLADALADRDRLVRELAAARAEIETMGQRWQSEMDERMSAYCAQGDALNATHEALAAAERERDEARAIAVQLREDLALAAQYAGTTTCEGCGAPIFDCEDGKHTGDVHGCVPFVHDDAPGPCWRYRTADGMDRAWPDCALAAALGPPPRGDAGPSGTRDGREEVGDV